MKIVDVSGFYSERGGGVRSYVNQKFEAAAAHGHELVVVAPGPEDRVDARAGGRIFWVKSPGMPFDPNYHMVWGGDAIWRILDAEAPDIVEGSSPWRGGWIAGRWPGACVKSLVFHQDFVAAYAYTLLDRHLSRATIDAVFAPYWRYVARLSQRFDVTIAGGDWLARRLASFGIHNPLAVPLGVERGRFSPGLRDESLRRELLAKCGQPDDGVLLIAVGRFHPEKRHSVIIDGFQRANERRGDLGLVLVGDGLRRNAVEKAAARAGHVSLLGAVADRSLIASIFASADILVHGSGAETFGLVVAEAICSGLAVVVPDSGGASDFAARACSEVYSTGDGASCGQAILRMIERRSDPAGAALGDGQLSVRSSEAHFSDLFELYQTLHEERRNGSRQAP